MNFIEPAIEAYATKHSAPESEILVALTRETHLKTTMPRMLSGHLQGRLLSLLSSLVQPNAILEIGTFTGYSTICLAEGLTASGKLYTIDCNDETGVIAKKYISQAGLTSKVKFLNGDAVEIIPTLQHQFDLCFIDADKENYLNYFHLVIHKMKRGGLIIADNVLWSGKVIEPLKTNDKETEGLINFTEFVSSDIRVTPLLLPIRDGLLLLRVN